MNKRVLFICKERLTNYGISTGLLNSSTFISDFLNNKKIESKVVTCKDANGIDKEIYHYKPTHVILSAIWVPPYKLKELFNKYKSIKWNVRIHSKLPFLANEGIAFEWLVSYNKISPKIEISANNKEAAIELTYALDFPVLYLPNIYTFKPIKIEKKVSNGFIDIGCFGAIRPLKNTLTQAVAAIRFGNKNNKKIRFHINSFRVEQNGEQVLKNIRALFSNFKGIHELVEHEWLNHNEFLKLVGQMEFGMQVSLSETFNIITADFINMEIPIIVSDQIEWVPSFYKVNPTKIENIVSKMEEIYFKSNLLSKKLLKFALEKFNKKSQNIWLKYLK